jgi:hypothetical protein
MGRLGGFCTSDICDNCVAPACAPVLCYCLSPVAFFAFIATALEGTGLQGFKKKMEVGMLTAGCLLLHWLLSAFHGNSMNASR